MNREMRRLQEAEERRRKKAEESGMSRAQRRAAAMQARAQSGERKPFRRRVTDYLHEVRVELRKVTWPNREQMIAFTTVTMITTIVLTAVVFGLDVVAKQAVIWLIERGT
ncbi:MAG TPA: preprotein translocase subunit SecE [Acidimicrobiia bacterium]